MKPKPQLSAVFAFLFIFPLQLLAQSEIDSLIAVLNNDHHDTVKIDLYTKLHQAHLSTDTTEAVSYINQAIALSEKINDPSWISRSYLKLCNYRWKKSQFKEAKLALDKVREQQPNISDAKIMATYYLEKAIVHYREGTYDEAIDNFLSATNYYQELGDTIGYAKSYSNAAMVYWQLEEHDRALSYNQKALDLLGNKTDELFRSRLLGNLGLIYRAKGDEAKALDYYQQSLEINRRNDHHRAAAINLQNIAALYSKQENYKKALAAYREAGEVAKEIDSPVRELYIKHGIATVTAKLGDYDNSILNLKEALTMALDLNVKEEVKNIYESFADIYEETGQLQAALEHRKLYEVWKDSIAGENLKSKVEELETKYEVAQKDQEIALLSKENEVQQAKSERQATLRNALIGGVISLILMAGLIFYTMRQRLQNEKLIRAKNEEIRVSNLKEELKTLEMKALRAQMNPHFLFNSLNSINTMIIKDDKDNASRYLTKFSKLVRLMLENSENPKCLLKMNWIC